MYHLRTLGTLDLRGPGGASLAPLLAQPKRAALLAYVALARPQGPVRRDILLATFWPELPDDRARAALRNALSFVRRTAPGVLAVRTDDAVAVADDALVCDVRQMDAALAAGDVAGALAHYGGDLLAGLHVDDAPGWEQWRDSERLRLRHVALAAARGAAEAARGRKDPDGAVALSRRACEIDPDDEPSVRRLMEMLAEAGDPAGALREYERFAARLMRELELEPAPGTEALRRALRVRAERLPDPPRVPAPASVPVPVPVAAPPASVSESSESASASGAASESRTETATSVDGDAAMPASIASHGAGDEGNPHPPVDVNPPMAADAGVPADPPRPIASDPSTEAARADAMHVIPPLARRGRWRRWAAAAVAGVLALGAMALPRMRDVAGATGAATVETRIAVLPFVVRTGPAHAYLGEGMADLLSVRLDGTGELTTVDPYALLSFLRTAGEGETGLDAGRAAAGRFGAGRFILGTVVEAGGRLHLNAAVYGADGRRHARAEVAEVREDSLFAAVDGLVRALVAEGMNTPPEQLDRTAALTTGSLPALKAYLAGERAFRTGAFKQAAEQFGRAVQGDSAFALASYRLSVAQDWAAEDGSAAAARALRLAHRLSPAEQRLLRARVAFRTGSAAVAEGLLRELVATRPDNVDAWNDLGEVLQHRAMWQGRSVESARAAWEQVVALDPANVNARVHLVYVAALQGRPREVDSIVRAVERLSPAHEGLNRMRTLRAFALRDGGAQAASIGALRAQRPRDANDLPAWGAAWRTADFLLDPAAGLRIAAVMTEPGRDAQSRLLGHTTRAHMQMARGRWRDARAEADSAAVVDPDYAARTWAFLAGFFPGDLPRDEVVRAFRRLAATAPPAGRGTGGPVDEERGRFPTVRHEYLLGVLAVRLGDAAETERRAAGLAAMEDTTAAGRFARHLRHQLRARALAAAGDGAGALQTVEAGWPAPVPDVFVKDDSYSTVAERYFRAQLLARAGRDREALAWFGSLTEDISRAIVFPVVAEAEQGRVLERMGRPREAAVRYARFADRWRDADPEAAARVRAARERGR
ncbi:MAG TPA: BTAD domain-containing putative transcriptional regulator [Longimicrobium sp.]|nr:BTAD domain-containing putative transcriptional regulator [Longimicrobium sp.]